MTNRTDMVSPDALVLTHALEKLRARDGLTHSRLDNSRSVEAAPLLGLAAVRRYAAVHDIELAQAALDVIKECVREICMVHSASWRTRSRAGEHSPRLTPRTASRRVRSCGAAFDLLGRRRSTLLSNWRRLHEALGLPPSRAAERPRVARDDRARGPPRACAATHKA